MPQITSGASASVSFSGKSSITVDAGTSQASFEYPTGTVLATFRGSRTFGPFTSGSGKVNSLVGAVNYQIGGADPASQRPVFVKSGRLVTADGDPVGAGAGGSDTAPTDYPGVTWSDPSGRIAGDYQVVGAGSSIAMSTVDGAQVLAVTTTTTSEIAVNTLHTVTPVLDAAGRVGIWVYVPDYTKLNGLALKVSFGDGSFTNGKFQSYATAEADKAYSGWHFVAFNFSEMGGTWGAPDPSTMTISTIRLGITGAAGTSAGNPLTVYLGRWVVGWKSIARLVFSDDDGYASWFNYGLPVLESFGIKAATSVIGGLIGSNPIWATPAQLDAAYAKGHTCYVHGATAMSGLADDNARRADIALNLKFLTDRGYTRDSDTYVWPNGVYQIAPGDQSCINILKDLGFRCARGTTAPRYARHAVGVMDQRWLVPIIGGDAATSAATIKSRIDAAVAQGDTAVVMWHSIVLASASGIDYAQQSLYEVAKYAHELRAQGKLIITTRLLP